MKAETVITSSRRLSKASIDSQLDALRRTYEVALDQFFAEAHARGVIISPSSIVVSVTIEGLEVSDG